MTRLRSLSALLVLTSFGTVAAEPPPDVKPVRVELHAAMPPAAVLRYALLPPLRDQKPGNAAPFYSTGHKNVKETLGKQNDLRWNERISRWRELPLDKFPRESARTFFHPLDPAMRELSDAARHEYADWDLTEKARKFGYNLTLMHLQELRQSALLFEVRARLAIADGRFDDAVRDLQTLMAMARHSARGPALVCPLVGVAIASLAMTQVDLLVQQPGAPNFYWPLSDLPRPFVAMRPVIQGEAVMARGSFPYLPPSPRDCGTHTVTPAEADKIVQVITDIQGDAGFGSVTAYKAYVGLDAQRKHDRALRELTAAGWPREALDRMPQLEVALLHGLLDFDRYLDEAARWENLPYWEAAPALVALEGNRRGLLRGLNRPDGPAIPLREGLGGAHGRVYFIRTRLERKVAALRCLEAIRLYAARHDGKLPDRLDDMTEVPVPPDPFTGKPFEYRRDGDHATLYGEAFARPGVNRGPIPQDALYYEITLKR